MKPERTILITGASSGIGQAAARRFADTGWNVAASMRNTSSAPKWMNDHPRVTVPVLDVTDTRSVSRAVAQIIDRFGKIDVLLNNAGYGLNGPLEGATDAQKRHQFDVNFFGLIDVTNAVLPHMRERKSGLILNVSSIGGLIGMPVAPLYIATKHAVEGLSESLRFELKPFGIRVKLIEPGGVKTNFISDSSRWTDHPDYADQIRAAKKMTADLDNSLSDPASIANIIIRAANDRSDRLRYLAKPGPYVLLHQVLPDRLWRNMIQFALQRQSEQHFDLGTNRGRT